MRSITCANDDDELRSEKLAVFREHAAPWQAAPPGGPTKMVIVIIFMMDSDHKTAPLLRGYGVVV